MGFVPSQIVLAQENRIRVLMYDDHLNDREIIKQLNLPAQTFYDYKRRIMNEDSKVWDLIHLESTKFRATQLISDLDGCRNFCLNVVNNDNESKRDRIDAYKTACEASANIVKILNEGITFDVSIPQDKLVEAKTITTDNKDEFSLDLEDNTDSSSTEIDDTAIAKINRETA